MSRPIIISVDDDPAVLGAVERDLRRHYRSDYRVITAGSGREANELVLQLKQRGDAVALFLVDERMPGMSGTEFLREANKLYPDARRVLLTAYADTQAAITGINEVGLDHYLLKPWDPPDHHLYPVLDDLLSDWKARVRLPFDGIRVAGGGWSPQSYATKEFLSRNQVPYQWIDVERDPTTRELVQSLVGELTRLPVVLFPDGSHLVTPSNRELAEKIGMQTKASLPFYDLVIVGGGPAGLAAAVYGASEGLQTLLIEQTAAGGQAGTSSRIENYLGFPSGVSGADLARRAATQALRFGAEILDAQEMVRLKREDPYRIVELADGSRVSCYALLLATGVAVRTLDAPGIPELTGIGVYYGASMTEGATYRGRDVCVLGGANSAGQGSLFFSRFARKVTILLRADSLRKSMSQYLIDRIETASNIEVMAGVVVDSVEGDKRLERIHIRRLVDGAADTLDASALFIFIGAAPRTEVVAGLLQLDEKGFILTGPDLHSNGGRPRDWPLDRDPYFFETCVPGIFAAGDVRAGSNKRVAAAVGEGSGSVAMIHRYLESV